MKKKILTTLLILVLLVAYGTFRLGNRSVTIHVDGEPAAGEKIRLLKTGEVIELDDNGKLDLAWGLTKQENPAFLFQSGPKNVWILRLPDKGTVAFNISGAEVSTDVEMSLGLFKLKRQMTQRPGEAAPNPEGDEGAEASDSETADPVPAPEAVPAAPESE